MTTFATPPASPTAGVGRAAAAMVPAVAPTEVLPITIPSVAAPITAAVQAWTKRSLRIRGPFAGPKRVHSECILSVFTSERANPGPPGHLPIANETGVTTMVRQPSSTHKNVLTTRRVPFAAGIVLTGVLAAGSM